MDQSLVVGDDARKIGTEAHRCRQVQCIQRSQSRRLHESCLIEGIRFDPEHVTLGKEPVRRAGARPPAADRSPAKFGAMEIRDDPLLSSQPTAQGCRLRLGRTSLASAEVSRYQMSTSTFVGAQLCKLSDTEGPLSGGRSESKARRTSPSGRPGPGAIRPSATSASYPPPSRIGIILATGRPRSVTTTASPPRTLASHRLASLRNSLTPMVAMCDIVAPGNASQRERRPIGSSAYCTTLESSTSGSRSFAGSTGCFPATDATI